MLVKVKIPKKVLKRGKYKGFKKGVNITEDMIKLHDHIIDVISYTVGGDLRYNQNDKLGTWAWRKEWLEILPTCGPPCNCKIITPAQIKANLENLEKLKKIKHDEKEDIEITSKAFEEIFKPDKVDISRDVVPDQETIDRLNNNTKRIKMYRPIIEFNSGRIHTGHWYDEKKHETHGCEKILGWQEGWIEYIPVEKPDNES